MENLFSISVCSGGLDGGAVSMFNHDVVSSAQLSAAKFQDAKMNKSFSNFSPLLLSCQTHIEHTARVPHVLPGIRQESHQRTATVLETMKEKGGTVPLQVQCSVPNSAVGQSCKIQCPSALTGRCGVRAQVNEWNQHYMNMMRFHHIIGPLTIPSQDCRLCLRPMDVLCFHVISCCTR